MSVAAKQVEAEALKLSVEERARLADSLWLSLDDQSAVDAAWEKEIEQRIREIEEGSAQTVAHEEVMAQLRARYRK